MNRANLYYNTKKRLIYMFLAIAMILFVAVDGLTQTGLGIKTVVIDPGHGGKDPGAIGPTKLREKDVVLSVGLKLGASIKKAYPKVKIIYTRSKDEFIGLAERAKMANDAGADLFISLHANAAANKKAVGAETWVLGLHRSAAALEVAKFENASILMEDGHKGKYEDFDPNDPDAYIALAMRQNAFLDQSLTFADIVQNNFTNNLKRNDRGVKQAGFVVLYRATMPAVLVELGFLSNTQEEKYLRSKKGQEELAKEIFEAFVEYKKANDKLDASLNKTSKSSKISKTTQMEKDAIPAIKPSVINDDRVVFKVQIATSSIDLATKPENFKGIEGVEKTTVGKFYKYTVGQCESMNQAKELQARAREKGYESAFIVAFQYGQKIDVKLAIDKTSKL